MTAESPRSPAMQELMEIDVALNNQHGPLPDIVKCDFHDRRIQLLNTVGQSD
ncbi:hypothetical protein KJ652_02685 [Patescibacteria group bacterium]|nr:hypothetical protein [Patescibacteria group bacterium]MBU1123473.1 hypothetical protein [Patescibacteria group bacterium]MBU1911847.1 hypothetical protein [Patescibacteria group bacterium]